MVGELAFALSVNTLILLVNSLIKAWLSQILSAILSVSQVSVTLLFETSGHPHLERLSSAAVLTAFLNKVILIIDSLPNCSYNNVRHA